MCVCVCVCVCGGGGGGGEELDCTDSTQLTPTILVNFTECIACR